MQNEIEFIQQIKTALLECDEYIAAQDVNKAVMKIHESIKRINDFFENMEKEYSNADIDKASG